ncbi:MAG: hypothetical protein KKC50_08095, partial [Candidatus Omnitrophica bacterium]|nr:hypothetical protein [Candidatus Omnitrophota bacterium]
FQTITPISGDVYELTGNIRGCFDTEKATHSIGDDFYYIPLSNVSLFTNDQLLVGTTKYFKLIPYNSAYTASITDADANTHSIVGRARKPYVPGGFLATGNLITNDIVLTWSPRVRGTGAGIGDADTITDASPTWEGYFEVEVWVGGVKKRTQTAIDAVTWTYTEAMNIIDNGTAQTDVTFKLKNYRTSDTITYSSAWTTAEAGW